MPTKPRVVLDGFLTPTFDLVRMQPTGPRLALVTLAYVCLAGCGNPTGSNDYCSPTITVSSGTTPQISWVPPCKINNLTVFSGTACNKRFECWSIEAVGDTVEGVEGPYLESNRISSGVRYGTVPATAREVYAPIALQVGQEYGVWLARYELSLIVVASHRFTP